MAPLKWQRNPRVVKFYFLVDDEADEERKREVLQAALEWLAESRDGPDKDPDGLGEIPF